MSTSKETSTIRVLYVEPAKMPEVIEIEHTLETLQSLVGGYIQVLYPWEDEVAVICDDEGKIKGSPLNRALENDRGEVYDVIAGNFIVAGLTEDSFGSLPDAYIAKYCEKFCAPEVFLATSENRLIMLRDGQNPHVIA